MGDVKERVVKVEIQREESKSSVEREIRIEKPEGIELSEEEMKKIVSATQNEIVETIRGGAAKQIAAKAKIKQQVEPVNVKVEVVAEVF